MGFCEEIGEGRISELKQRYGLQKSVDRTVRCVGLKREHRYLVRKAKKVHKPLLSLSLYTDLH